MKTLFILFLSFCSFFLGADGISIEYVTLDFLGGLDKAHRVTVVSVNPQRRFVELRTGESEEILRYPVADQEYFPGEWTITFEYWAVVPIWELEEGYSYICLPQVEGKDYLYLEDSELNWQKTEILASVTSPEEYMKNFPSSELRAFLKDPDLSLYAYSVLQERGELNQELILDGLWNYSFELMFLYNGPTLFHKHMEEVDDRGKVNFPRAMIARLEKDYQSSPAGLLDWYLREWEQKPVDLYVDFCSLYFRKEKQTSLSNTGFYNLIHLYQRQVPLEPLLPALDSWAFELPEGYDAYQYRYALNTLFQALSAEDLQTLRNRWEARLRDQVDNDMKTELEALLSAQ